VQTLELQDQRGQTNGSPLETTVNFKNCDENIDLMCAEEAFTYELLILHAVIVYF
jgi:hypothetical protein